MERRGERTWLTVADGFVGVSFLLIAFGVFAAPVAGSASVNMAAKLFGIASVMFAVVPIILAGHYNLYCSWGKCRPGQLARRGRVTKQEGAAIGVSCILVASGAWWIFS